MSGGRTTRAAARARAREGRAGQQSLLLDLPDAIVTHVLMFVPAIDLRSLCCASKTFCREFIPPAINARAVLLGTPVEAFLECVGEGEEPLKVLDFLDHAALRTATRAPCKMSADTCHTLCIAEDLEASGGASGSSEDSGAATCPWSWGGHENGPDGPVGTPPDAPPDALEVTCRLFHLGLGLTTGSCVRVPRKVGGFGCSRIVEVAAGYEHSLFRCSLGYVWSCGVAGYGRLGHGPQPKPLDAFNPFLDDVNLDGSQTNERFASPRRIETLRRVVQVAAGGFQVCAPARPHARTPAPPSLQRPALECFPPHVRCSGL
jgi:hypothetical protein